MQYAYSNNGSNVRAIEPGMETPNEVVFHGLASEEELCAAFPERAALLAAQAKAEAERILTAALQRYIDATAQARGYDGILSLCSYSGSSHPKFGPEGKAGITFRDAVWDYAYQVLAECEAGTRAVPSEAEIVAGAPVMVWP